MARKFELYKDKAGEFRFRLKAANGQVILVSEGYTSRSRATNGIDSVRRNATDEARFEKVETVNGKWRFNVRASNGQVIGTSETYESASARDDAIAWVMKNVPDADFEAQSVDDREAEYEALGTTQGRIEWSLEEAREDTQAFLLSALGCLDKIIESTERKIPNDPERRKPWEDELTFLRTARSHIEKLESLVPDEGAGVSQADVDGVRSTLLEYKKHFSSWPKEHAKEVTDSVWRGGLIAIFTGVGLLFGVPQFGAMIGSALFGGEKIVKVVQRIKPGGGG